MLPHPDIKNGEPELVKTFKVEARKIDSWGRLGQTIELQQWKNGVITLLGESPDELGRRLEDALTGLRERGITPVQMVAFSAAYNTDREEASSESPTAQETLERIKADEALALALEQERRRDILREMGQELPVVWASLEGKKRG